ncbi:50S ribosomal protein L13 [Patescibacteria group bacterium]
MTKTTKDTNTSKQRWLIYDASEHILGRLAVDVAVKLMEKDLPTFDPTKDVDTHVIVINSKDIKYTGQKEESKKYYRHSRYPGGLKTESLGELQKKKPNEVIRRAVAGMLPKNRLQAMRLKRLHIYDDAKHGHASQKPQVVNLK